MVLRNELQAAKMGFRESNEAHQRTAERNQACEEELRKAKEALDNLKTEKLALLEQVRFAARPYACLPLLTMVTSFDAQYASKGRRR